METVFKQASNKSKVRLELEISAENPSTCLISCLTHSLSRLEHLKFFKLSSNSSISTLSVFQSGMFCVIVSTSFISPVASNCCGHCFSIGHQTSSWSSAVMAKLPPTLVMAMDTSQFPLWKLSISHS
uniref:Uncharacterized protein n=1 Tax=Cacopsylla melanoneura TaxID=428564 RepID=A0A8D8QXK2_9HEMI